MQDGVGKRDDIHNIYTRNILPLTGVYYFKDADIGLIYSTVSSKANVSDAIFCSSSFLFNIYHRLYGASARYFTVRNHHSSL